MNSNKFDIEYNLIVNIINSSKISKDKSVKVINSLNKIKKMFNIELNNNSIINTPINSAQNSSTNDQSVISSGFDDKLQNDIIHIDNDNEINEKILNPNELLDRRIGKIESIVDEILPKVNTNYSNNKLKNRNFVNKSSNFNKQYRNSNETKKCYN